VKVPSFALDLDLCVLVYQLYHQSLAWPLDPWYDVAARAGIARRADTIKRVHDWAATLAPPVEHADPARSAYSGPSAARGFGPSNLALDPVITNYRRIEPGVPAFTRDGARFLAIQAPRWVVDPIGAVEVARYRAKPAVFPALDAEIETLAIRQGPGDRLIAFEGATGITTAGDPAWSLMGVVLARRDAYDVSVYDVSIAFRGSRSGSHLLRTMTQAQSFVGTPRGNADWITDLDNVARVSRPAVSKVGQVGRGFALALETTLSPILAALTRLDRELGPPRSISVTGHSLGAALATTFASAVALGTFGDVARRDLPRWPWDTLRCHAFALPVVGDETWASLFNLVAHARSIWVEGDVVVAGGASAGAKVLGVRARHGGTNVKLPRVAGCRDNPHETFHIRAALLRDAALLAPLPADVAGSTVWSYHETFADMLAGKPCSFVHPEGASAIVTRENLRTVLDTVAFAREFDHYLEDVYSKVVSEKSATLGPLRDRAVSREVALARAVAHLRSVAPDKDRERTLDHLESDLVELEKSLATRAEHEVVSLGLVLGTLQRSGLTVEELCARPAVRKILESELERE
jgi:hypothetical protein